MSTGRPGIKPFTLVRILATGGTIPAVEQDHVFLLVQNNEVSVCRLVEDPDFGFSMEHPRNEGDLSDIARNAVETNCPQYMDCAEAVVLICPEDIATSAEWSL
jgi:hypothetical protein